MNSADDPKRWAFFAATRTAASEISLQTTYPRVSERHRYADCAGACADVENARRLQRQRGFDGMFRLRARNQHLTGADMKPRP